MTYRLADDRSAIRVRLTSAMDTVKLSESPSGLLHRVDVFAWMFRRARSISSTSNTRYRRLKSNIFGKRLIYEIKGAYLFFRRNSSIECLITFFLKNHILLKVTSLIYSLCDVKSPSGSQRKCSPLV